MAKKKRPLNRRDAELRAVRECSIALERVYRHPAVTTDGLRRILGALYVMHVENKLVVRMEQP